MKFKIVLSIFITLLTVISIVLIYFLLFPKTSYYSSIWSDMSYTNCKCLGIEVDKSTRSIDAPIEYRCYGIVRECINGKIGDKNDR